MKITRQKQNSDAAAWRDWHILTVAEAGFSMLDIYGRHQNQVGTEVIQRFADRVNETNEAGSLHPAAPISAVPRRYFRAPDTISDPDALNDFKSHLRHFLSANESTVRAKRVLIDFHVSSAPVPDRYLDATEQVFREQPCDTILQEVVIFT